ncbi:MAG: SMP-30/gluconolactonase/LRE family protein [Betaproteobacteria bacterium]|nr:SMP-30/gluconolactonase/LRE family protein [Betaproteobacteria bacterium]MDH3437777.1 SMP-30/gluconolactonase/LRE family protein [Betaproteobacteria bacterium]
MFAAPPVIETEVFAELPASLRISDRKSKWLKFRKKGQPVDKPETIHSYLEGPSFDRKGNLYCVDIPYARVFRVSPKGEFTVVAEYEGEPNSLKIHQDGRIFVADRLHGILLLDTASGKMKPVVEEVAGEGFKGINDFVFGRNGDIYFTDQGNSSMNDPSGRVFRWRAKDGELELILDRVPGPNGIALNPSETLLFVNVTRMNNVWRIPLLPEGGIMQLGAKIGIFIQLTGSLSGPDGLSVDSDGGLAVCHSGLGSVWLFSKLGEPLYRIQSCRGIRTTNCAFGGPDFKTLYITESESGSILRARLPVAGHPLYSHR